MILGVVLGAAIYDLAINLRISYNVDTLEVYCKKGFMFKQVHQDTDVLVKTKQENLQNNIIYMAMIRNLTQTKSHIRHIINLIFELERAGKLNMQDWYSMIDDLDNFLELLNRKDNHGR